MTRDLRIGIVGVGFLAELLLVYAVFGHPPYVFYSVLRWTVATSAALGALALCAKSIRYLPLSVCLVILGGVHLFGKMRRPQWATFNLGAVLGLVVMIVILLIDLQRSKSPR